MAEAPALSVVIPAYDEAESLPGLHRELASVLGALRRSYEIIVVDDGSEDETWGVLCRLAASDSHLRAVQLRRNFGQTAALAAGFAEARGDAIITLDGDGQNDPADIPALVAALERGYDLAVGWRRERRDPLWRRKVPSWVANRFISWMTGLRLHDYGCTLKAFRAEVVRGLRLYGEMHRFIPAMAADLGARIVEVPVHHRPRAAGRSKYDLSRTIRVVLDLLTVKFLSSYSTRPIHVFGVLGLAAFLLGTLITGFLGFQRLLLQVPLADRPLLLLGILLMLIGAQFVTLGLLGEMLARTYHESQGKPVYAVKDVISGHAPPVRPAAETGTA